MKKFAKDEIAILLIDDNEKNLKDFHYILKNNGFYIVKANGGWEGMHALEVEEFHVMMVSMELRDMRGIEVSLLTRESFDKGELPILMYGDNFGNSDIDEAKESGANCVIHVSQVNDIIKRLKKLHELSEKYKAIKKEKSQKESA